ncbi:J517_1871 family lipoprotein [Halomonas sp. AOP43-F2-13]|uniref:J517_1871 family lipoprotein n=1 Tax=Halomonas sp. AOP43-F2-13 TaxID=3457657 RepID=UPI0040331ABD
MNKYAAIFVSGFLIFLSGCATGITEMGELQKMMDDYTDNDFVSLTAEPLDRPVEGVWSGNMGPFLVTMNLQKDGSGEMCSSYAGTDNVSRLKYVEGQLYSQEGGRFTIDSYQTQSMTLGSPYESSISNRFVEDSALREASNYCRDYFDHQG